MNVILSFVLALMAAAGVFTQLQTAARPNKTGVVSSDQRLAKGAGDGSRRYQVFEFVRESVAGFHASCAAASRQSTDGHRQNH